MKTITDEDGNVYVLKTDMEAAIKERISKVTSRAQEAEEQVRTLTADLDEAKKSAGISDTLNQQLEELHLVLKLLLFEPFLPSLIHQFAIFPQYQ